MRHLSRLSVLLGAAALVFGACDKSESSSPTETVDPGTVLDGKADGTQQITQIKTEGDLSLALDGGSWVQKVDNLRGGQTLRLYYDPARMGMIMKWNGCDVLADVDDDMWSVQSFMYRGGYGVEATIFLSYYEQGAWMVYDRANVSSDSRFAELQVPYTADQVKLYVSGHMYATSDTAPEPGESCSGWDSNLGADYWFDIAPPAEITGTLEFTGDWAERLTGDIVAGKGLAISYDRSRVQSMIDAAWTSKYGYNIGPSVYANVSVDNRTFTRFRIARPGRGERGDDSSTWEDSSPVISIPANAEIVSIYIDVAGYNGVSGYDSNFGQNYIFDVKR